MDNYRRRPPMEGFSRPGELGGEAFDDDSVEGHMMTDREEIQGDSAARRRLDDEDTEGHKLKTKRLTDEDDTEGHKLKTKHLTDEDDTEGHKLKTKQPHRRGRHRGPQAQDQAPHRRGRHRGPQAQDQAPHRRGRHRGPLVDQEDLGAHTVVDQVPMPRSPHSLAAARRSAVGRRLQGDVETRLLQSIVDATVRLFDAEAASIALFEQDPDRLEFRVAAGEQGAGAVGLTVPPTQGIAGFVYSTGQALALSDVGEDPRFNRGAAEQTGYVPRSIAAAPLLDDHGVVGVLQVLDKRGSPTFSLQDMELLGVFAGQATVAIAAARVQRDTDRLLRSVLDPDRAGARLRPGRDPGGCGDARPRRR